MPPSAQIERELLGWVLGRNGYDSASTVFLCPRKVLGSVWECTRRMPKIASLLKGSRPESRRPVIR